MTVNTRNSLIPHILFVDDEESARLLFSIKFRKEIENNDLFISFAKDGQDAWEQIEKIGEELLLINCDINMPNMDGYELLKKVKKAHPHIIFNIVSAYTTDEYVDKALALGATKFFTKPLDFGKLKENLYSVIEKNSAA